MPGGEITAIRDWAKDKYYTKSDLAGFFTKLNSGLTAYKLTFTAHANMTIDIVEDVQTDPQSYSIITDHIGNYTGLFFFHTGSDIIITKQGDSTTYTLDTYEDIIELDPYIIATPVMTSNLAPNTVGQVIYCPNGTAKDYGTTSNPFKAFNQSNNDYSSVTLYGNHATYGPVSWIGYEFNEAITIYKIFIAIAVANATSAADTRYKFQASADGETWVDIVGEQTPDVASASQAYTKTKTFNLATPATYKYFRLYCYLIDGSTINPAITIPQFNLFTV